MTHLELAALGKNNWWRYVLAFMVIAIMWQVIGSFPLVGMVLFVSEDGNPDTVFLEDTLRFTGIDPLFTYLAINFTFLGLLLGLFIAVRLLHERSFLSLITSTQSIDWQRMGQGFGVYAGLLLLLTLGTFLVAPDHIYLSLDVKAFLVFLPFALVLTPVQACAEEFLFRGYLMQWLRLFMRNRAVIAIFSGILFAIPHLLNPENKISSLLMPLNYFVMGLFLTIITLRDNGLELAMGAHSANNLYAFLIVNYEGSVLATPSIFTESMPDPLLSLVIYSVLAAAFYVIVFKVLQPRARTKSSLVAT